MIIDVVCDYCEGPVYGKPVILKFANIERFFCCTSCKASYGEKYHGRIESIKRKYDGKSELDCLLLISGLDIFLPKASSTRYEDSLG